MTKLKVFLLIGISCAAHPFIQTPRAHAATVDLRFLQNGRSGNQTVPPSNGTASLSERIRNVLRLPLPILGSSGLLGPPQQPSASGNGGNSGVQSAPGFLITGSVPGAIQSTIQRLSTLSHWPFAYYTTPRPQQPTEAQQPAVTVVTTPVQQTSAPEPEVTTTPAPTTPIPQTTTTATTTTTQRATPAPLPPYVPPVIQYVSPPPQPAPPAATPAPTRPSLPQRIHNRINSIGTYVRFPILSQIGQARPRPMITEPPWVTELLGPTLEPPTTRAPTLPERVQNAVQNVLLFVPATLLNFWYQNWGTQHVDRVIQQLQLSTPKPGSTDPVFATIGQNHTIFANLTDDFRGFNGSVFDLPTLAAFISANGTLMPTIVHPVVNKTTNTVEYQLRNDKETTVLWTGSLSNDIFFANQKNPENVGVVEADEDGGDQVKTIKWNIKL